MRRLFAIALGAASIVAGCADGDLCGGHDGTCIGLRVHGSGTLKQVDQIHVEVVAPDGSETQTLLADLPGDAGALVDLPIGGDIYLEPTVLGESTVFVEGLAGGRVIGGGRAVIPNVESGAHYQVSATLDVAPGGGAPCPASATFCDGFENDGTTAAPAFDTWTTMGPYFNGTTSVSVVVDDTHVFRGHYALHTTTPGTGIGYLFHYLAGSGQTTGTIAMRSYLYLDSKLQTTTNSETTAAVNLLDLEAKNDNIEFGVGTSGPTEQQVGYWAIDQATQPQPTAPVVDHLVYGSAVAFGAWMCVEIVVDLDQHQASIYATDAFAPDAKAAPVAVLTGIAATTYGTVGLGVTAGYVPWSTWFDDFAVGPQRLGCE